MNTTTQKPGFWASVKEITFLLIIVFLIRTFGFGLYQVPTGSMETTMLVGERFFADKFTPLFRTYQRGDIVAFNDPLFPYSKSWLSRIWEDYVWGPSNWTKRVIGLPGEIVEGKIEDGKPVIYINGHKLNEPYINKYPLIRVWKIDPQEIRRMSWRWAQEGTLQENLSELLVLKSYDPHSPYNDQPFYDIKPERIYRVADEGSGNELDLIYPGTPIRKAETAKHEVGKNHWNGSDEFYVELGPDQYWVMGDNRLGSKDCRFFGPLEKRLLHARIVFRIWSIDSDEGWWIVDLIKHPIDFWKRVRWSRFFQVVR